MRKVISAALVLVLAGCSAQKKITSLRSSQASAELTPTSYSEMPELETAVRHRDTLMVEAPDGHQVLIMKAVRDDSGEMVATDVLDAAVVTARFRNVAERNGLVDIAFDIRIPAVMQDPSWQLRLYPTMEIMGDTLDLDPVIITGRNHRRIQERGYQAYERFIGSIITDPEAYVNRRDLERFISRNLPQVYALKNDSSEVSQAQLASFWGITREEALEHYTNHLKARLNENRSARSQKKFSRLVKVPILTEGIRLDTVITDISGDFVYSYVQTINVRDGLRKVDVTLEGQIFQQQEPVWRIPKSQKLTFYISSLSSLTDDTPRYMTRVIERRVEKSQSYSIGFSKGSSLIDESLENNRDEISRIRRTLESLLENEEFDLDSVIVTAGSSPEGSFRTNSRLSMERSAAVSGYFDRFMEQCRDSIRMSEGLRIGPDGQFEEDRNDVEVRFISRSIPENWQLLETLVMTDSTLTEIQKSSIRLIMEEKDPDRRETLLSREDCYPTLREKIYPRLRTVRFDFQLHRKGMVKDTVHTNVIDSLYMAGLQAIHDREYSRAAGILGPYGDFNAAVAYCSLGYNASALDILKRLPQDDRTEYMLAVLSSRQGDDQSAVGHYLKACSLNPAFVHRGNLDPEISSLIKRYNLKLVQESPEDDWQ